MKKGILLIMLMSLFSIKALFAQDVVSCYTDDEKKQTDFWLDHYYYAVCTDYEGTGSKLFAVNPDYVDFNGGSTVDFTDIYVSGINPGDDEVDFVMGLWYGVGSDGPEGDKGAVFSVYVNEEIYDQPTVFELSSDPPAYMEIPVTLYTDYGNVIQLKQVKHWPIIYRIRLSQDPVNIADNSITHYNVSSSKGIIFIDGLAGNNKIEIYSPSGTLVNVANATGAGYSCYAGSGLYIVRIDGQAYKVVVE